MRCLGLEQAHDEAAQRPGAWRRAELAVLARDAPLVLGPRLEGPRRDGIDLCGNQPVRPVILRNIAWKLEAIEPAPSRRDVASSMADLHAIEQTQKTSPDI